MTKRLGMVVTAIGVAITMYGTLFIGGSGDTGPFDTEEAMSADKARSLLNQTIETFNETIQGNETPEDETAIPDNTSFFAQKGPGHKEDSDSSGAMKAIVVSVGIVCSFMGGSLFLAGVQSRKSTGGTSGVKKDTPSRVRLAGVVITLSSLIMKYGMFPIGSNVDRTPHSAVTALNDVVSGAEINLALLVLICMVVGGSFASIFHHIGGYLILISVSAYGYLVVQLLDMTPQEVFFNEFGLGVYVAIVGALIMVVSSVLKYKTVESDIDFVSGRR
jgi:hypothetical protein